MREPNLVPFVTVAAVCERALLETDGAMSLIRLIDTLTIVKKSVRVGIIGSEPGPATASSIRPAQAGTSAEDAELLDVTAVVSLKRGDVRSAGKVGIVGHSPSGRRFDLGKVEVDFSGEKPGMNVVLRMVLQTREPGLYWFDVLWDETRISSMPLTLALPSSEQTASSSSQTSPSATSGTGEDPQK